MNIFEDFYKKKITIEDFLSELSPISNVNQLREGLNKFNKKSPEEYLTQIFTYIMLGDKRFKKEFFKTIGIFKGNFKPVAEYKFNGSKKEIDVFAQDEKNILIIENKIGDRIEAVQPETYLSLCNTNFPVKTDKRKRYFVVLAKFSDLMPKSESDWDGDVCIKKHLNKKVQNICENSCKKAKYKSKFKGHYIYWYEIYDLLEKYFSNNKIKADLLEFLRNQNLNQEWCRDIGSPDWRKRFIEAYNNLENIEPFSKPSCGRSLGPLGNNKICFIGSRVQGARAAENEAAKNKEAGCFLKLEIKNKSNTEYIDLSNCCYSPIDEIIDEILKAYKKNSLQ